MAYTINEDGSITLSQEQLLAQASDVEGDELTALNLQTNNDELTIVDNGDGTFTLTPDANFNGDLDITFDVTDGTDTVAANIDLKVNPVNDAPVATDDYTIAAGPGAIRLDSELEHGVMQYQTPDGNWNNMEVGVEYPADTQVQYVPNEGSNDNLMDVQIGTFDPQDPTAEPSDWGTINDGVATFTKGDMTITTSMNNGPISSYNQQDTHVGLGIGDDEHNGLSGDDVMTVAIEGEEVNHVTFELSGLGDWFDADSNQATQVVIRAYDADGNLIDAQGGFRESGNLEDSYSFTTDQPVASFELGTVGGKGQYVVKNMTISRVLTEDIQMTSIQPDGSAMSNTHSFNLTETMDDAVNLTDELIEIIPGPAELPITVDEGGVLTLTPENLLNNDFDVDGDPIAIMEVNATENTHGTVELDENGNIVFTPDADYNGPASFTYTISDEGGLTDTATVYLNVSPQNDPPSAQNKVFEVNEDQTITFTDADLLEGSFDLDGDTLVISEVGYDGNEGVLTINGDGTYTFAPNENFSGSVDLSYKVSDGQAEVQADIDINVIEVNDPPVAGATSYTINEDQVLTFTVDQILANSYDPEIGVRLEDISYSGTDGILTINPDGETFTFAPNENFNGEIVLDVLISDGDLTDTTTANISVLPINDAPVSGNLAYNVNEDGSITLSQEQLLSQASDVDGDDLTALNLQTDNENLTITDNGDGTFTLTPAANFNGDLDISFDITDGTETIAANIDLTVNPVNDLPVAVDKSFVMNEDGTITITDAQLLQGASDVEGAVEVAYVSYEGAEGIFTDNGDGTYTFAPNENFNGDVALSYTVADNEGATVDADIALRVLPINDAPVSGNLAYSMNEDGSIILTQEQLLAQASDVEGDALVASNLQTDNENLTITDNGDGTFTLTPAANFNGDLDISFDITDGTDTIAANIDLTVNPVNDLPVAQDQNFNIEEDGSITFTDAQLLQGASDIDGDNLEVANVSYTGTDGVLIDNADGTYTFSPNGNFNGEIEGLSFTVSDGAGGTDQADININVGPVNDPPIAGNTAYTMNEDSVIILSPKQLLANSSDIEGDVALQSVSYSGTDGIFTANDDGTFSFAPNENFNGEIALDIVVVDSDGATDTAQAGINVLPINDAPVSGDLAYNINEDGSITLSQAQLLSQASDVDGDELIALNLQTDNENLVITDNGDGTFTLTPQANFNGNLDITFDVSDGTDTVSANIDLTVNPVNDLPVAQDQQFAMNEDGTLTITDAQLLQGASDIEGEVSIADVSYEGIDGIFTNNGDGTYTFAPNENFNGDVSLSFTVADEQGATVDQIAVIDVAAVNDLPVVGDLAYAINEDGSITLSQAQLLSQASDVDGDNLTALNLQTNNENLTITDNGDGTFTLTPSENYNGDFDITFDVSDGTDTVSANIDLTVNPVNDLPVAQDQQFAMNEDSTITITDAQLLQGASDVEGGVAIVDVSYAGTDGVFTDNGDGTYTFAPNENFNGDVALSFTVADEQGASVNQTANINVAPVNDAPIAGNTTFTMDEDSVITLTPEQLLANSSDIEGDVSLQNVSYSGTDGILTANDDGTFSFAPNENFNGDIALDITVVDSEGATDTARADIAVGPINDAPVSGNLAYSVDEDGAITLSQAQLLSKASDVDGDDLTALNLQSGNENLTITDNGDGTFTLTPDADWNGQVDLTFDVTDGTDTTTANLALNVNPVNDAPIAPSIQMSGEEDQVLLIDPAYITSQVTDVDGDEINLESLTVRQPANASLTLNADGMYELIGAQDWNGLIELAYLVSDGDAEVEGTLNVDVIPVNDAPFADGNAHMTILEDNEITFNQDDLIDLFGDVDIGDTLTLSRIITADGEDGGTINDNGDGTWTFVPTQDFAGTAELQVVVTDEAGEEATLDMPIYIRPVADGAAITTDHEGPLVFGEDSTGHLGLNVGMLDDSESLSNLVITGFPVGFTVSDGEKTIEITTEGQVLDVLEWNIADLALTPPQDYNGSFFLTVTATTADYGDEGSVPNDAAAANTDFDISAGESITFTTDDLLGIADGVEPQDGDDVGLVHLIDRSKGDMVDNGDGTYTFTPAQGYDGNVDFAFVIERGDEVIDVQSTIGVQAAPLPAAATSADTGFAQAADGSIQITAEQLLADMSDANTDGFAITDLAYGGDNGTLIDNGDQTWTFWPDPDYSGDIDLSITANDGQSEITDTTSFSVTADETASDQIGADTAAAGETVPANDTADYTAAPGSDLVIEIPESVAGNDNVDEVVISDLPNDATIEGALENADGDYVVSGDLSQPVTVHLGDTFEGGVDISFTGMDASGQEVPAANDTLNVQIDDQFAMNGSSANNASADSLDGSGDANSDWTSGDTGTADNGAGIMDDSNQGDYDSGQSGNPDDEYSNLSDLG